MKVIFSLLVALIVITLIPVMSYITYNALGVNQETAIKAQFSQNKNLRSSYIKKIKEAAQITEMQTQDLSKIIESALTARYGDEGSKALFQAIQEQNPTLDQSTYIKLQNIIAAGRDELAVSQALLIDKKAAYERSLQYVWSGLWLKLAGFPKIALDDYRVVTDSNTEEVFTTGTDDSTIKLR